MRSTSSAVPLVTGLLLALAPVPAAATASLTCSIDDRNIKVELMGNIGSGDTAFVQMTAGEIVLKAVPGRRTPLTMPVEAAHLVQQWTFDKDLRLGLTPESKDEVSLYLAIIAQQTKAGDDITCYRGRYVARLQTPKGPSEFKGQIKDCSAG